jgi:2-hydroxychromene-2-carboxylate isomerase
VSARDSIFEVRHDSVAGSKPAAPAVFFYDLASPECYLAAERLTEVLGVVPEWEPVLLERLPRAGSLDAFRCADEREIYMDDVQRRAAAQGLQPLRWPPGWPADTGLAMSVATYAKQIGRAVAFSLAAFRQSFAAGRDLSDPDNVVIAAAACEMHPAAVLKAPTLKTVSAALEAATARAAAAGVTALPALAVGTRTFEGPDAPEQAVSALAAEQGDA